jgi:hypothetical protein
MAGYYTQKRVIPTAQKPDAFRKKLQGQTVITSSDVSQPGLQTTTSYRSRDPKGEFSFSEDPLGGDSIIPNYSVHDPAFYYADQALQPGKLPSFDTGHPFSTEKKWLVRSHPNVRLGKVNSLSANDSWYSGPVTVPQTFGAWIDIPAWSTLDQNFFGSKLVRESSPTAPGANLSEALLQLAVGAEVPRVLGYSFIQTMQDKADFFKKLGSEYLNYTYGWIPYVQDLKELTNAVINSQKLAAQYDRDSGKIVRRSRVLPFVNTFSTLGTGTAQPTQPSNAEFYSQNIGRFSSTKSLQTSYKFSAGFQYYLPPTFNSRGNFVNAASLDKWANHLFGTRITPSTLWESAPWTWLLDWKFNVGDLLANYTNFSTDNLVMRWGYLQKHTIQHVTNTLDGIRFINGPLTSVWESFITDRKERIRATPYGFGLNPATFSDRQWSILAAIGLTISPKKLP